MVDEATDMTPFGRGEKVVDMVHMGSGLVKPIETSEQLQAVATFIAPAGLGQGDRVILGTFAECGRTFVFHAKGLLIALINTPDNVLNRLSIKLLPKTTACLQCWGSWKPVHLGMGRFC